MEHNYTDSDALDDLRKIGNLFRPFERYEQMMSKVVAGKSEATRLNKEMATLEDQKAVMMDDMARLSKEKDTLVVEVAASRSDSEIMCAKLTTAENDLANTIEQLSRQKEGLEAALEKLKETQKRITEEQKEGIQVFKRTEQQHTVIVDELVRKKSALESEITGMEIAREKYRREVLGGKYGD